MCYQSDRVGDRALCERMISLEQKLHIFKLVCFIGKPTEKSQVLIAWQMLNIGPNEDL